MFCEVKEYGALYDDVVKLTGLQAGDVFIDIGANLGQEIEYFSNLAVTIDSYEPHPYFFKKLVEKYSNLPNVTLNQIAVSNVNKKANFYFKKPSHMWSENHTSGGASLIWQKVKVSNQGRECIEVTCEDIVDIVSRHDKIKILKIDIEGAEYSVLKRLIETNLIEKPEFLFFEDHSRKIANVPEFANDRQFFCDFVVKSGFKARCW